MAEYFLTLGRDDQREVLEIASAAMGRPAHLLEKDVWVVWALSALEALLYNYLESAAVQLSQIDKALNKANGLTQWQAEQNFTGQAKLDGGITDGGITVMVRRLHADWGPGLVRRRKAETSVYCTRSIRR